MCFLLGVYDSPVRANTDTPQPPGASGPDGAGGICRRSAKQQEARKGKQEIPIRFRMGPVEKMIALAVAAISVVGLVRRR